MASPAATAGADAACAADPGGRKSATFGGASVFLSRSLVAPEVHDAVHDALRLNGAAVFLCSDPSRAGPLDFHVISSSSHEKFEDLRARGCNLLGPQCILSCAKEHRVLPKQGYTCCLAMDGVKVLCSGFDKDEKVKIEQLVKAMGGVLQTRASMDVNFVIVKNVLAAKYKWALKVLKKPIVSMNWLDQCWIEHRIVPQEHYRILPFTGLNICVTKITADERKELQKIIVQNGGQYSADLTRKCTHLVSNTSGGDKYIVARRWGNIHIVHRRWVDQSVARRACLDEGLYPLNEGSTSFNDGKSSLKEQQCLESSCASASFQPVPAISVDDLTSSLSQNLSASFGDASNKICTEVVDEAVQKTDETMVESRIAEDSEAEDNDLYLSNCRISLVGFEERELSKLVIMIRKGGGSRHMLLSEKLTHIVVGAPSEVEKKEVRRLAAWGVINVVKPTWLEECNRVKREVVVSSVHIATDLLVSKETSCFSMDLSADIRETKTEKTLPSIFHIPTVNDSHDKQLGKDRSSERKGERGQSDSDICIGVVTKSVKPIQHNRVTIIDESRSQPRTTSEATNSQGSRCSNTFKGRTFCFSNSFPHDRRTGVVDWVRQGGGVFVDDQQAVIADFLIDCHGLSKISFDFSHSTVVSTHWIRSCLEEGCLQDVRSHIIYSPLRCRIPFPGFEGFHFCVSQYEKRERLLLRNLCVTLGAKFTEKYTKKVTHLLCKFAGGPKYENYHQKGIPTVTADWLSECVRQDSMVPFDQFRPKQVTSEDRDAGLCTVSQYPTQAANMVSRHACSQSSLKENSGNGPLNEETNPPTNCKKSKLLEFAKNDNAYGPLNEEANPPINCKKSKLSEFAKNDNAFEKVGGCENLLHGNAVPDVADAIEDLLAQSSKIQNMQSPRRAGCERSIFAPDHSIVDQDHETLCSTFGVSRHRLNQPQQQDSTPAPAAQNRSPSTYDAFSETQTESQVVGYEEDLTGRQKIIDRVRSQSLNLTPSAEMPSAG